MVYWCLSNENTMVFSLGEPRALLGQRIGQRGQKCRRVHSLAARTKWFLCFAWGQHYGRRFKYENFARGFKSQAMRNALDKLERAMIIRRVWATSSTEPPLRKKPKSAPKLLPLDVGLNRGFQETITASLSPSVFWGLGLAVVCWDLAAGVRRARRHFSLLTRTCGTRALLPDPGPGRNYFCVKFVVYYSSGVCHLSLCGFAVDDLAWCSIVKPWNDIRLSFLMPLIGFDFCGLFCNPLSDCKN